MKRKSGGKLTVSTFGCARDRSSLGIFLFKQSSIGLKIVSIVCAGITAPGVFLKFSRDAIAAGLAMSCVLACVIGQITFLLFTELASSKEQKSVELAVMLTV